MLTQNNETHVRRGIHASRSLAARAARPESAPETAPKRCHFRPFRDCWDHQNLKCRDMVHQNFIRIANSWLQNPSERSEWISSPLHNNLQEFPPGWSSMNRTRFRLGIHLFPAHGVVRADADANEYRSMHVSTGIRSRRIRGVSDDPAKSLRAAPPRATARD